jgi:hypothetical protein
MSKRLNPKVVAGAVAGLAVAGGGVAVAATQFGSPKEENQAILNDAAKQLGVQPSALSAALKKALENRVDAAVAAGRLTKAQGDELKQRIESGAVPFFVGPGLGGGFGFGFHHAGPFGVIDVAARYLGLTDAQLRAQLESGKSLAEVAKAQGKSVDGLVNAIVAAAKKRLDAAVADGRLTRSQADSFLGDLKSRVTSFLNGGAPRFGPLGGPPVGGFDGPGTFDGPRL